MNQHNLYLDSIIARSQTTSPSTRIRLESNTHSLSPTLCALGNMDRPLVADNSRLRVHVANAQSGRERMDLY